MDSNEIKYEALRELGYTEEPDFNSDEDKAVNAINGSYPLIYKLALTSFDWSFAKRKDTLVRLENTGKYKYKYTLPRDLLYIRGLYSEGSFQNTVDRYERNGDKIYTDSPELHLMYTYEVGEEELPPYFLEYFIYALARKNCTKITGDRDLLQEILHNEQVSYSVAKNTDIKQQAVRVLPTGVFTDVRF
jgi:hypothetical protein